MFAKNWWISHQWHYISSVYINSLLLWWSNLRDESKILGVTAEMRQQFRDLSVTKNKMYFVLNICKHLRNLELRVLRLNQNIIWIWKLFLDWFFFILKFSIDSLSFHCNNHFPKKSSVRWPFHIEHIKFNNVIFFATHDLWDCTIVIGGVVFQNQFFKSFKIVILTQLKFVLIKYFLKFSCKIWQWTLIFNLENFCLNCFFHH